MSEWIKRSEQEPPKDGTEFVAWMNDGAVRLLHWQNGQWFDDERLPWELWKWWVPMPPRTVTIEISEDDAKSFSRCFVERGPSMTFGETARLGEACRKALEAKR